MTSTGSNRARRGSSSSDGDTASILSIATGVPSNSFDQAQALQHSLQIAPAFAEMGGIFDNTGIASRYSSVPLHWYHQPRGWQARNSLYIDNALELLEKVVQRALARAEIGPDEVAALVLVSSSGFAMPSLDARLANRLGLSTGVQRSPLIGLGCAGGATGLARASQIAAAMRGKPVLLAAVELGGLNTRLNPSSAPFFVSTALFGDGAAAVVLMAGGPEAEPLCRIAGSGERMWRDTERMMGWDVMENGLDVVLSGNLPRHLRDNLSAAANAFLCEHALSLDDLDGVVAHPGSSKVLDIIQTALGLGDESLPAAREILRDYGNMSAPAILFVLDRAIAAGARGRHLMVAFGPGLTASFLLIEL